MKVLVPLTTASLGGSQLALLRLMESCPTSEILFHCWLFGTGPLTAELDRRGIPWESLPRSWLQTPWGLMRLRRHLQQRSPDAIYLHASRLVALAAHLAGIPCAERINMPRAAGAGGWCRFRLLDHLLTNLNTKVLVVSEDLERQLIARGVAADKVIVLRDLIYPERFRRPELRAPTRAKMGIPAEATLVFSAGRFVTQKAPLDLLRVAAACRSEMPRARFALAGDGPLRGRLMQEIARLGLGELVHVLPFQEDVSALFAAADIYLQTSRWEGLATVLLEAMAAGLAIVATDVDGTREALTGYPAHRLVQAGDIAGIVQALRTASPLDPASAPAAFPSQFTAAVVCDHFVTIMRQLHQADGATWKAG